MLISLRLHFHAGFIIYYHAILRSTGVTLRVNFHTVKTVITGGVSVKFKLQIVEIFPFPLEIWISSLTWSLTASFSSLEMRRMQNVCVFLCWCFSVAVMLQQCVLREISIWTLQTTLTAEGWIFVLFAAWPAVEPMWLNRQTVSPTRGCIYIFMKKKKWNQKTKV